MDGEQHVNSFTPLLTSACQNGHQTLRTALTCHSISTSGPFSSLQATVLYATLGSKPTSVLFRLSKRALSTPALLCLFLATPPLLFLFHAGRRFVLATRYCTVPCSNPLLQSHDCRHACIDDGGRGGGGFLKADGVPAVWVGVCSRAISFMVFAPTFLLDSG